jgi:hypothetical protein
MTILAVRYHQPSVPWFLAKLERRHIGSVFAEWLEGVRGHLEDG